MMARFELDTVTERKVCIQATFSPYHPFVAGDHSGRVEVIDDVLLAEITYHPRLNKIYIKYRGTEFDTYENWMQDFNAFQVDAGVGDDNVKVHTNGTKNI